MSTPEQKIAKPQRVLACVLCQQRKIKCERKFPCTNCVKSGSHCVPAALIPRQRRRRFPERELLDRLRHYEGLLRQNNIKFEPLHTAVSASSKPSPGQDSPDDANSPGDRVAGVGSPKGGESDGTSNVFETKSMWRAMNQKFGDSSSEDNSDDNLDFSNYDVNVKKMQHAWKEMDFDDGWLFGAQCSCFNTATMHPTQVQIFKLWQIYLQNVSPLLKVTHTPTLQARIIDAAGNIAGISPVMEALMFSIYCAAVNSLSETECEQSFGQSKRDLSKIYKLGCQQALHRCAFLSTTDRECLTALYLYLISNRSNTNPRAMLSMSGVAVRIAQRLAIHNEDENRRHPPFEAEMRRRLWWSLMAFDARSAELGQSKESIMNPTWSCALPLNVDDFNLQVEMKSPATLAGRSTEAVFAVVRGELCDFVRHNLPSMDFQNPTMKMIARHRSVDLDETERIIEEKYLAYCNPDIPLHYMTMWLTRGQIAKGRLVSYYAANWKNSLAQTDAERDMAVEFAIQMLNCDTKIMGSPLTQGFKWHSLSMYPMPGFIHIIQDMRRRGIMKHAKRAWEALSDNYEVRFKDSYTHLSPFITIITRNVLQAWAACEDTLQCDPPRIVIDVREKLAIAETPESLDDPDFAMNTAFPMSLPGTAPYIWPGQPVAFEAQAYDQDPVQQMMDDDWSTLNWNTMKGNWF